ncbi:MAG: SCO family protein [Desulfuromonadaceae bacterium]|nr:SCO family protein [Desulfuromonadaceae bacterium]
MKNCLRIAIIAGLLIISALTFAPSQAGAASKTYKRTVERYHIPDIALINQEGKNVRLKSLVDSGKPVIVDFIFGTCTTICPVLSASFTSLQNKLGADSEKVHLLSVSIDPENDTPRVMRDYLKRYRAKPGWDFLTGSRKDVDTVMKSFDAYISNKMSHYAVTFIHMPGGNSWIRIDGITSTSEFIEEIKKAGLAL